MGVRPGHVTTRCVGPDELAATRRLWEAVHDGTRGVPGLADTDEVMSRVEQRLARAAVERDEGGAESYRLVVAYEDEAPVGLVALRLADAGPLLAPTVAVADVLHVDREHRRSGVGQALLAAMAAYASATGAQDVCVHVPTANRDANRYYARWGFAASTTRRTIPVAVLRRKLGAGVDDAPETTLLRRLVHRRAVLGRSSG